MPVKKGRDFSEMSSRRQRNMARRYVRLAFMLKGQIKEKSMFTLSWQPATTGRGCWAFLLARAVDGVETVGEGFNNAQHGGGRASRTGQREAHLPTHTVRSWRERRITSRRAGVSGEVSRVCLIFDCQPRRLPPCWGHWSEDRPGLRLPGSVDTFEQGVRAILGRLVVSRWRQVDGESGAPLWRALPDAPDYVCFRSGNAGVGRSLALKALGMPLRRAGTDSSGAGDAGGKDGARRAAG